MHMNHHPSCAYGSCDTRKQTPGAFILIVMEKVLVLVTYLLDIHITCLLPFEYLPHEYHINAAAAWAAAFCL